jgi:tRNA nucleotidyltransferase (CCA-adding enzyme)
LQESPYPQRERLLAALAAAQSVATHEIAEQARREGLDGPRIGEKIHKARVQAVSAGGIDAAG